MSAPRRMVQYLPAFFKTEAAGGVVMLVCAALALLWANSSLASSYQTLVAYPLGGMTLKTFVSDMLMPIFFLTVGMELKREMREGFLSKKGQKILPLIAALGGIAMPAIIYLTVNRAHPEYQHGWAIPTATDIAFAVCVLSLLGKRVPTAAKIFLLAIAIYDDLAAIIIIAVFYGHGIAMLPLMAAATVLALMVWLNGRGEARSVIYLLLGAALWHFLHAAGIHTTVAGMLTGLLIPLRHPTDASYSPLNQLLHALHPLVAFGVLPLFALLHAGIDLSAFSLSALTDPLPLGILLGLVFGKPIGIFAATAMAVKLRVATRPEQCNWAILYGVAVVAGIGFTMSLFIGTLAFHDVALHHALTIGVMAGSLVSALGGMLVLRAATR